MTLEIIENVPLAEMTTFKIGGKARFFVEAEKEESIIEALEFAAGRNLKVFILGGGSNVLISDEGFSGLVIKIALKGIERSGELITAAAGEDWDDFVDHCVKLNLQGIECLSGIPGLVGGTPVQNVGAYGQEVSESIVSVRLIDRLSREIRGISNADCRFTYRKSIFNSEMKDRYVVLSVTYRLNPGGTPKIAYKDLQLHFGEHKPSLAEAREAICRIRAEKAMLVRQGGPDSQSAGSFFKNPIVSNEVFAGLTAKFGEIPSFKADEGFVKIPAAWLIEKAGFPKGYLKGNAGLSTKHTLALTNRGGASAQEIIALKAMIEKKVAAEFGIQLITEPVLLSF